MSDIYNDADGAPANSRVLTIGGDPYVAEDITWDEPGKVTERFDQNANPSGQFLTRNFTSGSATLQLADDEAAPPALGATFSEDLLLAGSAQTWFISNRGAQFRQGEFVKVPVSFRKRVTAVPT